MRFGLFCVMAFLVPAVHAAEQPNVPKTHPRLFGSRADLQSLAKARPQQFERMQAVARDASATGTPFNAHWRGISLALVAAINEDKEAARDAQQLAMKLVNGP